SFPNTTLFRSLRAVLLPGQEQGDEEQGCSHYGGGGPYGRQGDPQTAPSNQRESDESERAAEREPGLVRPMEVCAERAEVSARQHREADNGDETSARWRPWRPERQPEARDRRDEDDRVVP